MAILRQKVTWSQIARHIVDAVGGDLAVLQTAVKRGSMMADHFTGDGVDLWTVTWVDGAELVIAVAQGEGLREAADTIMEMAHDRGLKTIRWHTARAGLGRLLKGYSPELTDYVYRVKV